MPRPKDAIPDNVLRAARAAGLKAPDWYVGPRKGTSKSRRKTLADIAREVGGDRDREA